MPNTCSSLDMYTWTLPFCNVMVTTNSLFPQTEFQFDVIPTSVVAFIGERVEYYCVAPCSGIFWLTNDAIAGADHNIVVSTWTRPRSDGEPGEESTLWITASVHANNSVIKCCVEDRSSGFETHSSPAYLTVQGIHTVCFIHSLYMCSWATTWSVRLDHTNAQFE